MKITKLCMEDNRLSLYLNNLDDLQAVFESISQEAVEFFDDCFYHTSFCLAVQNAEWKKGRPSLVFNQTRSVINQTKVNEAIEAVENNFTCEFIES